MVETEIENVSNRFLIMRTVRVFRNTKHYRLQEKNKARLSAWYHAALADDLRIVTILEDQALLVPQRLKRRPGLAVDKDKYRQRVQAYKGVQMPLEAPVEASDLWG